MSNGFMPQINIHELMKIFPEGHQAEKQGPTCASAELNAHLLLAGYLKGYFPWPQNEMEQTEEMKSAELIPWFCPSPRAVFDLRTFKLSKSQDKLLRRAERNRWSIHFAPNEADFRALMQYCAQPGEQCRADGTWIEPKVIEAYSELFSWGLAYGLKCVNEDGALLGGLYGVHLPNYISAESMFFLQSNGSKYLLLKFLSMLMQKCPDYPLLDIQALNPFTAQLGGIEIERQDLLDTLVKCPLELQILLNDDQKQKNFRDNFHNLFD